MTPPRSRAWGGVVLVAVLLSSLWLAGKMGGSPPFKVAVFLFGCSVWIGILTWARDTLAMKGAEK